jgi:hypothetical protein
MKALNIEMVLKLINNSIYQLSKDIATIEDLPNYLDNEDYRNDVRHLNGKVKGLEDLKEKINILF